MRLGFWNRLAVVATVLALLVVPVAIMVDIDRGIAETRQAYYEICVKEAASERDKATDLGRFRRHLEAERACWDSRFPADDPYRQGWSHWREYALGTLMGAAILYALLWLVVATAKWVWAGRTRKIP